MKEDLSIELTLTLGGTAHAIPGASVRALSLHLTCWGAEGTVELVVQDDTAHGGHYEDTLLDDFVKPDLGEVKLTLTGAHTDVRVLASLPAIAVQGLVVDKRVTEEVVRRGMETTPVLFRRYRLRFVDAARLIWRQHHPCDLFTQKSFKDVLEAHKGAKITLSYDWEVATAAVPLLFFCLEPRRGASFYDLCAWYVHERGGVLAYDQEKGSYALLKEKDASGTAATLPRDEVERLTSLFPEVARYKPRVVSSYSEDPKQSPAENPQALEGVFRDILFRTPIAQQIDDRVTLESARPFAPGRLVELEFAAYPTVAIVPRSLLTVAKGGGFSADLIAATEPYRVIELHAEARALRDGPDAGYGTAVASFELSLRAVLEAKSDPVSRLPAFVEPHFPAHLEGKIVSALGEEGDVTYEVSQDQDTSVDQYKVVIPLFASQEIVVPFEPSSSSGTLYLPLHKQQRVLVAFEFERAWVERLLDYRDGARVPQDGQGQHLLFGKSAKSNTSVLHDYQDSKPVLRILRTNDKDTAMLQLEEGKMTLRVTETKEG